MQLPLSGYWQLSPLSDLTIPQDDIVFPAPFSQVLPKQLTESQIKNQEWHLMHDIDVDEKMLGFPVVDLVIGGVDFYAEVRINGEAVFDCDGSELTYRKDIQQHLRLGRNRIEILFLEQEDEDWLLYEENLCTLGEALPRKRDSRLGIWETPYLHFIQNVRLDYISTEQIWHHGGGCEFKVDLFYQVYASGLVSASVKFDGMTYQIPLDIRSNQATAIFQVEAPRLKKDNQWYLLTVELDEQKHTHQVGLNPSLKAEHYPV
ncbi:glycosyl hydrolase 2 galactose-binding domain-containing protein [Vibrio algarum]|uniref:Beta-mannosidase-like galactose-binding domain-containing protein n=1 Tax=Vibrio algarum TaxID=3020714 RepID=A0ABT4YMY3_9VIBR|nr:hypothetical protein [Vibrio sp. KJ40-1]MDB1122914.1 hypothetical protein [Vibrio sp. KJ40-1]